MKRKMRRRNWKHWTKETSRLAHEAKARKRMANPVEREPVMVRWNRFELRSLRDAAKRLSVLVKNYS